MKRNFAEGSIQKKRKASEGEEDRIRNLPNEIIDHVLDYLPILDAARTTILSRQWRHVWPMHPKLIFDKHFLKANWSGKFGFHEIITMILVQHRRPILEFFLDLQLISDFSYVDQWLDFLLGNAGVKKLSLVNSNPYYISLVTLMPDVLSCSSLEHLELKRLQISTPCISLSNLTSLSCEKGIFASKQSIDTLKDTLLNPNLKELNISLCEKLRRRKDFDLSNLLERVPKIEILRFDSYALKFLGADTGLIPRTMEYLEHLTLDGLDIEDLGHASAFVCLLQSCPNLRILDIKVVSRINSRFYEARALKCLKALECKERKLHLVKLKTLKIIFEKKREPKLIFLKLLLSCSPSLDSLMIGTEFHIFNATKTLLGSSQASQTANNIYRMYRESMTTQHM